MDTKVFWAVIGAYNGHTWGLQIILLLFLLAALALSYGEKRHGRQKFALGIANLWIAFAFFARFGTEAIQKSFALPLFLLCGVLFLYESRHSREDFLRKPDAVQGILLLLCLFYPLISVLLGGRFPQIVTHIMPCPIASLSIGSLFRAAAEKTGCSLRF